MGQPHCRHQYAYNKVHLCNLECFRTSLLFLIVMCEKFRIGKRTCDCFEFERLLWREVVFHSLFTPPMHLVSPVKCSHTIHVTMHPASRVLFRQPPRLTAGSMMGKRRGNTHSPRCQVGTWWVSKGQKHMNVNVWIWPENIRMHFQFTQGIFSDYIVCTCDFRLNVTL